MTEHIRELLEIVQNADPQAVEYAREDIRLEDLPVLAEAYWSLLTWSQKAAMVHLAQDHFSEVTLPIFWDFLDAPGLIGDDEIDLGKAIALCHLKRDFNIFTDYYADRHMLHQHVLEVQADAGRFMPANLPEHARRKSPAAPPEPPGLIRRLLRLLGF